MMIRTAGPSCLHGEYALAASTQSTSRPMPRAIHVRLSEEALNAITSLAGKGKGKSKADAGIVFSENESVQTLTVASTVYQLTRSAETQPHEIYARTSSSEPLQPVGRLSHKLIVQHQLGSSMSSRVRERNEAAIHERGDRRAIALEYDHTANGARQSTANRAIHDISRRSASPGRSDTTKSRHTNLLVASHQSGQASRKDRRSAGHLSPSNLHHSFSVEVEDIVPGSEAGVKASVAGTKDTSSSSTDTNSSLALSHSPGTSVSSADSPPSKIGQKNAATSLDGLGISAIKSTAGSAPSSAAPEHVQDPLQSAGKRKRASPDQTVSPDPDSATSVNRVKRSSGPKANARTAGGARLIRPVSSSKPNAAFKKDMNTPSSDSTLAEITKKRKLQGEEAHSIRSLAKERQQGAQNWYTSSEAEEEDADGEIDLDHQQQDNRSNDSPIDAKSSDIRSHSEYQHYHSQFTSLHAEYVPLRNELLEQRRLIQALIQGDSLSALERQNIRSKNEISIQVQKVKDTRDILLQLKKQIWAYAEVA